MTAAELYEHLGALLDEDQGHRTVLLTDIDDQGTGRVYEPVEVGLLLGDDDGAWISIDLRLADTSKG